MSLITYDPLMNLQRFQRELNKLFQEGEEGDTSKIATSQWAPAVDIKEEDDRYLITADIPGVDPKDIEVTMAHGMLTIKGERKYAADEEKKGYRRVERIYGSFYRRFSLPDDCNAEKIAAAGKNGVLEITIPKQEKSQPRRISVGT
jgi:HSP20 family protein